MKQLRNRNLAYLVAASLLAPAPILAQQGIDQCRDIESSEERLQCYDNALAGGKSSQEPSPEASPPAAAAPVAGELSQETLFGKNAVEVQEAVNEAAGVETIDRLESTVSAIRYQPGGKVIVKLDNGQVWRQTTAGDLHLDEGDTVIIRKAALGSFLMQKSGKKKSVRVTRDN